MSKTPSYRKAAFLIGFGADAAGGVIGLCTSNFALFVISVTCFYCFASSYWLAISSKRSTTYGVTLGLISSGMYLASMMCRGNPLEPEFGATVFFQGVLSIPPLVSGVIAASLGARQANWARAPLCFIQGAVAGAGVCLLHIFCLWAVMISTSLLSFYQWNTPLSFVGFPLALGAASMLYLPLMHTIVSGSRNDESKSNTAINTWLSKLTIAKSGVFLFIIMLLAGIGWAALFR